MPEAVLEDMQTRLGANAREARLRRGWTQEEAAERCDLSTRVLRDVEAGRAVLRMGTIARLAAGLRVDPGALFRRVKNPVERRPGRPPKKG